jgi:lysophospholipase L1-like esterase
MWFPIAAVGILLLLASGRKERKPLAGIILLGDSNAVGLGPRLRALASERGINVHVDATGGSGVAAHRPPGKFAWDAARVARAREGREDWPIVLSLGGNDTWMDEDAPDVQAAVAAVCSAAGERLWWLDLPLPGLSRWGEPAELWRACAAHTIDATTAELPFLSDRIHLTSEGYRLLAELVLAQLEG